MVYRGKNGVTHETLSRSFGQAKALAVDAVQMGLVLHAEVLDRANRKVFQYPKERGTRCIEASSPVRAPGYVSGN